MGHRKLARAAGLCRVLHGAGGLRHDAPLGPGGLPGPECVDLPHVLAGQAGRGAGGLAHLREDPAPAGAGRRLARGPAGAAGAAPQVRQAVFPHRVLGDRGAPRRGTRLAVFAARRWPARGPACLKLTLKRPVRVAFSPGPRACPRARPGPCSAGRCRAGARHPSRGPCRIRAAFPHTPSAGRRPAPLPGPRGARPPS